MPSSSRVAPPPSPPRLHLVSSASASLLRQPSSPSYNTGSRMLLSPSRLPRFPPRRLRLHRSVSPMASTLAFLRPSALAPLAAAPACSAAVAVRVPSRSRVSSRVSLGSQVAVSADALFADYKPATAFLFPGQGAQTVGMGAEAQSVPAAAKLFNKANDILGYDLLDLCTNGPKEMLDSTVISQPAICYQPCSCRSPACT